MKVAKFSLADAALERSPGQDADVFAGNVVDQRHRGPITIGYGRYGPNQTLDEIMAVARACRSPPHTGTSPSCESRSPPRS
jgi:ethanolamine utilization protein EutQ (cupin superfamily)